MSSPSNLIVVITHLPDVEVLKEAGRNLAKGVKYDPDERDGRLRHTDQAVASFVDHVSSGVGWIDGAEGAVFTWGYSGNYVNSDDFIETIEPFIRELVVNTTFASATIFWQPHDAGFRVHKLDGSRLESKQPNLKLRASHLFTANDNLSFDVDITNIRCNDVREPTQGPPEAMSPEAAKNVADLEQALSAGGHSLQGKPYASIEDLDRALRAGYQGTAFLVHPEHLGTPAAVEPLPMLDERLKPITFDSVHVKLNDKRQNCAACKLVGGYCAFDNDGMFVSNNHECATMRMLRTLCDDTYYEYPPGKLFYNNDQTCGVIPFEGKFFMLGWYKMRGRVEVAVCIDEETWGTVTQDLAEACLEFYKTKNLEVRK